MSVIGYAGSSGRVQAVLVAISPTSDVITYAGSPATIAEITAWKIDDNSNTVAKLLTFESEENSSRVIYPQQLAGGTGLWTASIEGILNATTGDFSVGQPLVVDLLVHKGSGAGRSGNNCKVKTVGNADSVTSEHANFAITVEGDGVIADFTG